MVLNFNFIQSKEERNNKKEKKSKERTKCEESKKTKVQDKGERLTDKCTEAKSYA